jgi:hypothetical protein
MPEKDIVDIVLGVGHQKLMASVGHFSHGLMASWRKNQRADFDVCGFFGVLESSSIIL